MNKIDEMITRLCPEGVCVVSLKDVCRVLPSGVDKRVGENERPVKLCNYMDVYANKYITPDLVTEFMDGSVSDREYDAFVLKKGQVLLTKDSETAEDIAQSAYVTEDFPNVVCGYHVAVLTPYSPRIDGRFLNYLFETPPLRAYFTRYAQGVSRYGLKLKTIEDVKIPLPPLDVQREIVFILDRFRELEAELEAQLSAELEARRKQYEYYSRKIFEQKYDTQYIPIKNMGSWTGGCTPSMSNAAYWYGGVIPWISSKDMKSSILLDTKDHITKLAISETPIKLLPKDTVAVVVRSGILKHSLPVVFVPFPSTVNQDIKALVTNENVLPKYAYYAICAYSSDILKKAKKQGGTVDSLDVNNFMQYEVPVPPLEEQRRIVSILDKFSALVSDISSGLPAEIAARRKQYEYYRDRLLSFKEAES